jgi:hypothetical protein
MHSIYKYALHVNVLHTPSEHINALVLVEISFRTPRISTMASFYENLLLLSLPFSLNQRSIHQSMPKKSFRTGPPSPCQNDNRDAFKCSFVERLAMNDHTQDNRKSPLGPVQSVTGMCRNEH